MRLTIPEVSLVLLIGPPGSGKSEFAARHFRPAQVISVDECRRLISDEDDSEWATEAALDVLHLIVAKRLETGRLVVIDASSIYQKDRKPLLALARKFYAVPCAVVFDLSERVFLERNRALLTGSLDPQVIRRQLHQLRRSLGGLQREGFRHVYILSTPEEVDGATVEILPMKSDLRHELGPFDIVGDIHGCFDELTRLLEKLGYDVREDPVSPFGLRGSHPHGRRLVFVGDLVDRGPKIVEVLKLAMSMVRSGTALCLPGNHDMKLLRKLKGQEVFISHGLAQSLEQIEDKSQGFRDQVIQFLSGLASHYVLDGGRLVVAHAGMKEEMQGRGSARVRDFALYGETTGEIDEFGLPVRLNWAGHYRGHALVVYGHTPVPEAEWLNGCVNVDTGCVFGGKLTALRYPERELVSVPAARTYYEPSRPFLTE